MTQTGLQIPPTRSTATITVRISKKNMKQITVNAESQNATYGQEEPVYVLATASPANESDTFTYKPAKLTIGQGSPVEVDPTATVIVNGLDSLLDPNTVDLANNDQSADKYLLAPGVEHLELDHDGGVGSRRAARGPPVPHKVGLVHVEATGRPDVLETLRPLC